MQIKKYEDFTKSIETEKEVLETMPKNNKKNLKLYLEKVSELEDEYGECTEALYNEIIKRSNKYLNPKENERLTKIDSELKKYEDLHLFNPLNTPFEKMGFDTLLYSLTHYYKNDLNEVNKDIQEALDKFSLVGINLTEEDFVYSYYARKYIKEYLKDNSLDRMKDVFEDLHWKCPDVISHIETSFRILFDKNIKKFEEYIENRKREIIVDNLTYEDYLLKRTNLLKEKHDIECYDDSSIIRKFMAGDLLTNDYTPVQVNKAYSKFLGENYNIDYAKGKIEDFKNLLFNLEEYKYYLKYSYVVDDVKEKYQEREKHLDSTNKLKKEIEDIIKDLETLNEEVVTGKTKGFLFFKKKVDIEENFLKINELVKELDLKYEEYDNENIYSKINECIEETSSIHDVLQFVYSYKGYLRSCIKTKTPDIDINKVKEIVKDFGKFISNPNLYVLRNVNFKIDTNVAMIIIDHYKLLKMKVLEEDMTMDTIDAIIKQLEIIINNYYLENTGLNINFIIDLFESKKIIEEHNLNEKRS